jgi:hypothetical protein
MAANSSPAIKTCHINPGAPGSAYAIAVVVLQAESIRLVHNAGEVNPLAGGGFPVKLPLVTLLTAR